MRKYPVMNQSTGVANFVSHIGTNHLPGGSSIGGYASSYDKAFDDEDEVALESGIADSRYCVIGDIKEAYQILKEEIVAKDPRNLEEYAMCVINAINRFFGDFSKVSDRLSYFPTDDDVYYDGKEVGQIANLAHKNAAQCVERSMLAQNLLMELGIKSIYKSSGVIVNGKQDAHAYNLVSYNGKHYIFDATIPTIVDGKISPLICEIPEEVFNKISRPENYTGYSVEVSHYNPLRDMDYTITYDAGREEEYKVEEVITK